MEWNILSSEKWERNERPRRFGSASLFMGAAYDTWTCLFEYLKIISLGRTNDAAFDIFFPSNSFSGLLFLLCHGSWGGNIW